MILYCKLSGVGGEFSPVQLILAKKLGKPTRTCPQTTQSLSSDDFLFQAALSATYSILYTKG